MDYKLAFKKSVSKDLKKLPLQEAAKILNKIEMTLPGKAATLPILQGQFAGLKKYRIGNYRVIFSVINDTILILRIQDRKDVYRN